MILKLEKPSSCPRVDDQETMRLLIRGECRDEGKIMTQGSTRPRAVTRRSIPREAEV